MGLFARIGWGAVDNKYHDLGIDLFIQVRDDRLFDRVALVCAQVKSGPSWFSRPAHAPDGTIEGWWYYEADSQHFDDWVRHPLPHLLVLYHLESRLAYWAHVTSRAVTVTGKGCKILVPVHQTLDIEHLDLLLAVAATSKPTIGLQGSAWTEGLTGFAPGQRLRYALLAPRLIAPHGNQGYSRSIDPEEALALVVQGQAEEYVRFAAANADVPDAQSALTARDWRWRFVGALFAYLTSGDMEHLVAVADAAPNEPARSAACVALAVALIDIEDYQGASDALSAVIETAEPVDHAWLAVQQSRCKIELGDIDGARDDAANALRATVIDRDDLTALAIRAAATWLLYRTAGRHETSVQDLVTASDTAVSWWRDQLSATAFSTFFDQQYKRWADQKVIQLKGQGAVHNDLLAASLNAHLVGEEGAWRLRASRLAKHDLVTATAPQDIETLVTSLNDLRRCGDSAAVGLAVQHLWRVGPIEPILDAADRISGRSWTYSSTTANLQLWAHGGDVLGEDRASAAAAHCMQMLASPATFADRGEWDFDVEHDVLRVLPGLLGSADNASHDAAFNYITGLEPPTSAATAMAIQAVLAHLRPTLLDSAANQQTLADWAEQQTNKELRYTSWAWLAEHHVEHAANKLAHVLESGDISALPFVRHGDRLPANIASAIIQQQASLMRTAMSRANAHTYGPPHGGPGKLLIRYNTWYPQHADWQTLTDFLLDPLVLGGDKRPALLEMIKFLDRIPEDVTSTIQQQWTTIVGFSFPVADLLGGTLGAAPALVATALGTITKSQFTQILATALADGTLKADAARLITLRSDPTFFSALIALSHDNDLHVRSAAARAVGEWVAKSHPGEDVASGVLEHVLHQPGVLTPLAAIAGVAETADRSPEAVFIVAPSESHQSAKVRAAAKHCSPSLGNTAHP